MQPLNGLRNYHTHTTRCKHATDSDEAYVQAAIENGILERVPGEEYKIIGKNNQPVMEDLPLEKLGFEDGDTLTVISKPVGACPAPAISGDHE